MTENQQFPDRMCRDCLNLAFEVFSGGDDWDSSTHGMTLRQVLRYGKQRDFSIRQIIIPEMFEEWHSASDKSCDVCGSTLFGDRWDVRLDSAMPDTYSDYEVSFEAPEPTDRFISHKLFGVVERPSGFLGASNVAYIRGFWVKGDFRQFACVPVTECDLVETFN